jgi:preprotein translocase subunit SecF
MNRELIFLRTFAFATVIGMVFITTSALKIAAPKMAGYEKHLMTSQSNTSEFRKWVEK